MALPDEIDDFDGLAEGAYEDFDLDYFLNPEDGDEDDGNEIEEGLD